jgi:16S rRNA (uracil1498-N3)-methyltransferase
MRRVLVPSISLKVGSLVPLEASEAKHLTSVLRLGPDDEIQILDGSGLQANAKLVFRDKSVYAEILETPQSNSMLLSLPIHLFMSVIKGDAMEWVIEKAAELGVRTVTPVETEFSVVKLHKRGVDTFQDRWQRIADQSLKQSGRLDRMEIRSPVVFEQALLNQNHLLWLDEISPESQEPDSHLSQVLSHIQSTREKALLVGPEGGFSPAERNRLLQLTGSEKHEITRASLGSIILRAETAAICGISMLIGDHYGKREN